MEEDMCAVPPFKKQKTMHAQATLPPVVPIPIPIINGPIEDTVQTRIEMLSRVLELLKVQINELKVCVQ